jgi:death on curing protein
MTIDLPAMLGCDEVERIHFILCDDFADELDPIAPSGVKSPDLLASAVSRQQVGLGNTLKYPDPLSNAATLTYGICNDHPFHNGNKRTALVAMLAHLDKNRMTVAGVRQKDLYEMMLAVAAHRFGEERVPRRSRRVAKRPTSDQEVGAIGAWLNKHAYRVTRGERQVSYRQLRPLLKRHGYDLGDMRNNTVDIIYPTTERRVPLLRREPKTVWKRIGNIAYPGDTKTVSIADIKQVRRMCRLTEEDGVDSSSFYEGADVIDSFVNQYRQVLRRLART